MMKVNNWFLISKPDSFKVYINAKYFRKTQIDGIFECRKGIEGPDAAKSSMYIERTH